TNRSAAVAFFLRADVRRGGAGGDDQVLPITWSDDDVTLWPGQSQTLTATYATSALGGAAPVVSVAGWNQAGFAVAAPFGAAAQTSERALASGVEHVGAADGMPAAAGAAAAAPQAPAR